jgi:predicted nucleic acid-binding protein
VICVDTNIICYHYMASPFSAGCRRRLVEGRGLDRTDSVAFGVSKPLAGSIRRRSLTVEEAIAIANLAEAMLDRKEFTVSTSAVLQLVSRSNCPAYDCEFVALAHANGVRLLTVDRQILREFPEVAISLKRFVQD